MTKPSITSTNHPLPFSDLSPLDFERMCLWLVEREGYLHPQHLGEAGGEQGRDVVAYRPTAGGEELWYFQCKRYKRIGAATLKKEVDKYNKLAKADALKRPTGVIFVTNALVSAHVRDDVAAYCQEYGYQHNFWAHTELDMRVKKYPDIVKEFFCAPAEVLAALQERVDSQGDLLQQVASNLKQMLNRAGMAELEQATQTIAASLPEERPLLFEVGELCSGYPMKPSPEEYFVAHEFSEAKIADLRQALAEGLRDLNPNLKPYTADQDTVSRHILCKIASKIQTTLFSIFDLPRSQNRNVYLELGIAIGLGRPFILTKEEDVELPTLIEGLDYFGFASYSGLRQQVPEQVQIGRFGTVLPAGPVPLTDTYFVADGEFEREDFRNAIHNALRDCGLQPAYLMENQVRSGMSLTQLITDIQAARFGIYRIDTRASANSFIALGIAIGLNRPWLLVAREGAEIPADVRGLSTFKFNSFTQLQEQLETRCQESLQKWCKGIPQERHQFVVSTDGAIVADDEELHRPLPEFNQQFFVSLEAPGGAVILSDKFYIERDADTHLQRQMIRSLRSRTATTIRGPRQIGKTSLLIRGIHQARQNRAKVVHLDVQSVDRGHLETSDSFLRYLAELIVREFRLDPARVEESWRDSLGPQDKLTYLMEGYVLAECDAPIVLAMDEADRLLQTPFQSDFFALLRSWFNRAADHVVWRKFSIVMAISTEPYLLIADPNRSPVKEGDFPHLMELLNGHPYLTRQALYAMAIEQLTWAELVRIADTDHGPFGGHLRHHYRLLCSKPGLKKALKQAICHDHCTDKMAFFRLQQAGLVKGNSDVCRCRCDLYRLYFEDKL